MMVYSMTRSCRNQGHTSAQLTVMGVDLAYWEPDCLCTPAATPHRHTSELPLTTQLTSMGIASLLSVRYMMMHACHSLCCLHATPSP